MITAVFFAGALAASAVQAVLWGAVGFFTARAGEAGPGEAEGAAELWVMRGLAALSTAATIALAMLAGGLR